MLLEKKYLSIEYLGILCVGMVRYDPLDTKNKSLISIGNFINYFFTTKVNPYSQLSKVFESENLVYIKIWSLLISFKISNPNMGHGELKQELINQIENTTDNNSFNKAQKFIDYLIKAINLDRFNNSSINIEYERCIKFILLNESINNLLALKKDFFITEDSHLTYDLVLADIFKNYQDGIVNDDFVIESDEEDISNALEESVDVHDEIRAISFLEDIRFLEKKRVAILIGASGAGKSMFLCHATAEYVCAQKTYNKKHLIFYFTFENSKAETFLRIVANMINVEIDQLKLDMLIKEKKLNIIKKFQEARGNDTVLIISELSPKRYNMTTIEAIIDKNLLKYKDSEVYAVMLDYVDKMLPVSNNKTLRTDESLGLIVDDFKALTKKYDTCGITVSQFNREGAKKARSGDEMATATDIGGGWSKYENADIVITMQVKNTYEELGYNIVVMCNEKHRYYRDGTVIDCIYQPQFARFSLGDADVGGALEGIFSKEDSTTKIEKEEDIYKSISIFE